MAAGREKRSKNQPRKLSRLIKPFIPAAQNLAAIPLTIAGLGCIDAGVFFASFIAGLIITGLSLILIEHLGADE